MTGSSSNSSSSSSSSLQCATHTFQRQAVDNSTPRAAGAFRRKGLRRPSPLQPCGQGARALEVGSTEVYRIEQLRPAETVKQRDGIALVAAIEDEEFVRSVSANFTEPVDACKDGDGSVRAVASQIHRYYRSFVGGISSGSA